MDSLCVLDCDDHALGITMLNKLTLKLKLAVGFGALQLTLVAMGVLGFFSIRNLADLSSRADRMADEGYRVRSIEAVLNERKADIRSFLISGDEQEMQKYEQCNRTLTEDFDQLASLLANEQDKALFQRLRQAADANDTEARRVAQLKRGGKTKEAAALLMGSEMGQTRTDTEQAVADFVDLTGKLMSEVRAEQASAESSARNLIFMVSPIGIVTGLVMSTLSARGMTRAAGNMVEMIQQIADKNLVIADMDVTSTDELGQAGIALNAMKNNLRELVHSIARTAEHVASASEEISSSATQQAQSAETQKGQATQVAVAMQEMSSTVREVSENSNSASEASRQAAETARQGGMIVEDSLAKMQAIAESVSATAEKVEELGKSSDQIGRIIGVIDDIADQTNLLALNAAIEAARAGEQGRGFAVVADEVRKLAERTTSATKEVAQMVQNIQNGTRTAVAAMHEGTQQVQEGVETTAKAGDSLKQIIRMSEQVGEMVSHIATAATEQSSATEQVNLNVEQITRLVTEAAAGAQQSAQACQDLSGLALDLQKMVSNFRLESRSGFGSSKPAVPRVDDEFGEPAKAFAASSMG
jgi:methyl-accepting chemotaxis protein